MAVIAYSASIQDRVAARAVLMRLFCGFDSITMVFADGATQGKLIELWSRPSSPAQTGSSPPLNLEPRPGEGSLEDGVVTDIGTWVEHFSTFVGDADADGVGSGFLGFPVRSRNDWHFLVIDRQDGISIRLCGHKGGERVGGIAAGAMTIEAFAELNQGGWCQG